MPPRLSPRRGLPLLLAAATAAAAALLASALRVNLRLDGLAADVPVWLDGLG